MSWFSIYERNTPLGRFRRRRKNNFEAELKKQGKNCAMDLSGSGGAKY
jgi:hypothetical protein